MMSTTNHQDFKIVVRKLMNNDSFLPARVFRDEKSVEATILVALNNSFAELKQKYKYLFHKPPYSIGMSYIHELAQMEADTTGTQILNVSLVSDIGEIRRQLDDDEEAPLSGLIFLRDSDCENAPITQLLISKGAKNVGWEATISNDLTRHTTRGAPFFVANKKVLLAINSGRAPILKSSAEELRLFTFSSISEHRRHDVTLTMRFFEDLKKVINILNEPIYRPIGRVQLENHKAAVCLGFRTFQYDSFLYHLAMKLSGRGLNLVYYVLNTKMDPKDVIEVIQNETIWDAATNNRRSTSFPANFESDQQYTFILAPPNVVDYAPTTRPSVDEPIFLSIPMPHRGVSFEITRQIGAPLDLIELAQVVMY